eukprot:1351755-Pleurochrysis_carterae.AAC.1
MIRLVYSKDSFILTLPILRGIAGSAPIARCFRGGPGPSAPTALPHLLPAQQGRADVQNCSALPLALQKARALNINVELALLGACQLRPLCDCKQCNSVDIVIPFYPRTIDVPDCNVLRDGSDPLVVGPLNGDLAQGLHGRGGDEKLRTASQLDARWQGPIPVSSKAATLTSKSRQRDVLLFFGGRMQPVRLMPAAG